MDVVWHSDYSSNVFTQGVQADRVGKQYVDTDLQSVNIKFTQAYRVSQHHFNTNDYFPTV